MIIQDLVGGEWQEPVGPPGKPDSYTVLSRDPSYTPPPLPPPTPPPASSTPAPVPCTSTPASGRLVRSPARSLAPPALHFGRSPPVRGSQTPAGTPAKMMPTPAKVMPAPARMMPSSAQEAQTPAKTPGYTLLPIPIQSPRPPSPEIMILATPVKAAPPARGMATPARGITTPARGMATPAKGFLPPGKTVPHPSKHAPSPGRNLPPSGHLAHAKSLAGLEVRRQETNTRSLLPGISLSPAPQKTTSLGPQRPIPNQARPSQNMAKGNSRVPPKTEGTPLDILRALSMNNPSPTSTFKSPVQKARIPSRNNVSMLNSVPAPSKMSPALSRVSPAPSRVFPAPSRLPPAPSRPRPPARRVLDPVTGMMVPST